MAIALARTPAWDRDVSGLRVAGESENRGIEREHLNGVHGSRLRIVGLRAAAGPGIELLELVLFHEYFHGETGRGAGASHQTGWTALAVRLVEDAATARAGGLMPSPGTPSTAREDAA
jgi:hypothetical protein